MQFFGFKKTLGIAVAFLIVCSLFVGVVHLTGVTPTAQAQSQSQSTGINVQLDRYNTYSGYDTHAKYASEYAFDSSGNEYQLRAIYRSGGSVETADLNPGSGTDNFSLQARYNLFITKFDASGNYVASYYLAYSATTSALGTQIAVLPARLRVTDQGIFVFGEVFASPFTVRTTSSTTTLTGQTGSNRYAFLLRYDTNMTYQSAHNVDNIVIQDVEQNPNGGFYVSMQLQGTADIDFMSGGTTSLSLTNSPSTDGILARFNSDATLNSYLRYNSVTSVAGSDVYVDELIATPSRLYALVAFNSNITPVTYDLDPTSGTQNRDLHEHDPIVAVFDHSGNFIWANAVTSSDVYGSYSFTDDENVQDIAIDSEGSVYVAMYVDSDAVKIGNTTYVKNIQGLNNVYETFVYKINASGAIEWSKYFPSVSNTSTTPTYVYVEPLSGTFITTVILPAGGAMQVDGITYTNSYSISRYLFIQMSSTGTVQYVSFLGVTGTTSDLTYENIASPDFVSYTNPITRTTKMMVQIDLEGVNQQFNMDFSKQSSSNISTINDWVFHQLYYTLTPRYASTGSSAGTTDRQPEGCTSPPPVGKAPWLFGAIPTSSTSVKLFVAPGDGPFNSYTFRYGPSRDQFIYGWADVPFTGSWIYDIEHLEPGKSYTFQVRSGNGCAVGPWSHEVTARTLRK